MMYKIDVFEHKCVPTFRARPLPAFRESSRAVQHAELCMCCADQCYAVLCTSTGTSVTRVLLRNFDLILHCQAGVFGFVLISKYS